METCFGFRILGHGLVMMLRLHCFFRNFGLDCFAAMCFGHEFPSVVSAFESNLGAIMPASKVRLKTLHPKVRFASSHSDLRTVLLGIVSLGRGLLLSRQYFMG